MIKRFFSVIIIPHHKGKYKKITLSEKKARILGGVAIFLFIALLAFLSDYFTMNVTRQRYKDLREENMKQKETIAQYKISLSKLKLRIERFEKYAKKLNVMAGLKSHDVLKEVGLGNGGGNSQEIGSINSPQDLGLNRAENISQKAEGVEKNLSTLVRFFEDQSLRLASTPTIYPTNGWITSPFGMRDDPFTGKRTFHYGIDIATNYGNPIMATADGIVAQVKKEKIGGNTVILSHRGGYSTVYCHLSKFLVKPGQKVKRGDVIGLIGKTGKALGPHVHYEVRLNGKSVNPYYYLLEE